MISLRRNIIKFEKNCFYTVLKQWGDWYKGELNNPSLDLENWIIKDIKTW